MKFYSRYVRQLISLILILMVGEIAGEVPDDVLNKQQTLERQTFWDNRDFDWYADHIPFFECSDSEITTTWYYRWELLTKHLTYGSPNTGYVFTEFIDRPFWSGAYGAISCPAGHQLYESRWLRSPEISQDYLRYWFRTAGAQPRNYSTWLADATWALHQVHPDDARTVDLLDDLVRNFEAWEKDHFVPEVGLFWQTGHDDGMEFNINSRQTQDILRGAPSYRPSFNAYMWADANAIERIAILAGNEAVASRFRQKAQQLQTKLLELCWDRQRHFFFPLFKNEEERDGHRIQPLTRTYESGKFAGDPHGRELIGYVPWQFGMIPHDPRYWAAWEKLMDPRGFFAEFGPTTVERQDPLFLLQKSCCWWSGQSWPYATTQTLKGLANVLQSVRPDDAKSLPVSSTDYVTLLGIYARSHRKQGTPYLAEALHPDTGSFEGHDAYNHSEHYFHSGFCDLVVTGLVGLIPNDTDEIRLHPLAPGTWDYFALEDLPYRGHRLTILWDRLGTRYGRGAGFHLIVDDRELAQSSKLERLIARLPDVPLSDSGAKSAGVTVNFAVNNDGDRFPRIEASYVGAGENPSKLIDGNYWYHVDPPNRWTTAGSPHTEEHIILDLGVARRAHTLKLYFLDDRTTIIPPRSFRIEIWNSPTSTWKDLPTSETGDGDVFAHPVGRRATTIRFQETDMARIKCTLVHNDSAKTGLTEIELWGDAVRPVVSAPPPVGNLAWGKPVKASFTSPYDQIGMVNDGKIVFGPTPHNRWTSYASKSETDWLELDLSPEEKQEQPRPEQTVPAQKRGQVGRLDLYFYDDRGGVQAPRAYRVEYWHQGEWHAVSHPEFDPPQPQGGRMNSVRFEPVPLTKFRITMEHAGNARSGLTEIEAWEK